MNTPEVPIADINEVKPRIPLPAFGSEFPDSYGIEIKESENDVIIAPTASKAGETIYFLSSASTNVAAKGILTETSITLSDATSSGDFYSYSFTMPSEGVLIYIEEE